MTLYFIQRQDLITSFLRVRIKIVDIMFQYLKIFLLFFFGSQQLNADVLVRMEVQQGAIISSVNLRLFEEDAPLTVENFLKYVGGTTINRGNYNNSFIHRSVPNFVVQGGGFTFDPALNDGLFSYDKIGDTYPGGLQKIQQDPAVQNEFNRSNLRGTIAMAKLADQPDSATSQWFINLVNNSSLLDGQNGGFTVFGEVILDGMTIVDEIANQTANLTINDKTDIHSAFGALPLVNYTADPVLQENLVRINTIIELLSISADIDFKLVLLNTSAQSDITIKNTGNTSHSIGSVSTTDMVDAPFNIIADTCSNSTLAQGAECVLTIQFSPQLENVFNDTFNIELTDLALSYSFSLRGEGVLTIAPDIAPSLEAFEFGEEQLYDPSNGLPARIFMFVNNDGNIDLNVTSGALEGADSADFELFDNCTNFKPVVPPGEACGITIDFKPITIGEKSATLTLFSNDPDENPLVIPITGTASIDTDGVPTSVENAAPNGGDGNNDGVMDSIQSDVASLPGTNGSYLTLLTSSGTRINNISMLSADQVMTPPDNIQFRLGVLDFEINKVPVGGNVEVGIILLPGDVPTTYYMYGPTPDNTNPHWYEFLFDGTTGAQLIGKATITSPDGVNIERNLIRLIFKDGERGDADLSANGVIVDLGGSVVSSSDTNSGSLNVWLLLYLSGIVVVFRLIHHNRPYWSYKPQVKK